MMGNGVWEFARWLGLECGFPAGEGGREGGQEGRGVPMALEG